MVLGATASKWLFRHRLEQLSYSALLLIFHQQVWPSAKKHVLVKSQRLGRTLKQEKGKTGAAQPTTILLVEPPPALLLLQPPQQPTHSLLAKEASVSNQIARGLNSEIDLFSAGESKTKEAGAQHRIKLG